MSEYAGRIAVGAVVALAVVVGLGFELSNFGSGASASSISASSSTGSTVSTTFTCTGGSYRNSTWVLIYNLTDGRIRTILSPCNALDSQKGMGLIDVTTNPVLPILLANGYSNAFYVNLTSKQITQIPGVTFSPGYLQAFYNGQEIINGTVLPNPYSTQTSTSSEKWCTYLDGTTHVLLTPLVNGPINLLVVTDQGIPVSNGTIYASNRVNATNWQGSNNYCLLLSSNPKPTGFPIVLTENDSRLGDGVYNFTVVANYGVNQTSRVVVPDIAIQPNTTVYITISVPSGQVTTVTVACSQNSCTQSTTTSTAKRG